MFLLLLNLFTEAKCDKCILLNRNDCPKFTEASNKK